MLDRIRMRWRALFQKERLERELVEELRYTVLLSHGLWQRRFGGDPQIIGRQLRIDGRSMTVSGVMPPGFRFERDRRSPRANLSRHERRSQ